MTMDDRLITVARFDNRMEFVLARSRLESAGIECFARNEYLARFTDGLSGLGQFELQVREADAEDAAAMLNSELPLPESDGEL